MIKALLCYCYNVREGRRILNMPTFLLLFSTLALAWATSCDYEHCPKGNPNSINLHFVPHTHDDVGWLKTPDQYYYGGKNNIQDAGVQYILDSVVQELINDPQKRFIYVETAFFWDWWQEQTDAMKHRVKKLVNDGQLEFIGGAWSMNDEAATHYHSIIDQFTWGFRRLSDNFGKCGRPKVGWQIDPFGHSRENAAIMAKMGFDGLFLGRIDWQDKSYRANNKTMEMIWKTSQNDDTEASSLFTGVLYNTYSAPKGFCFDINCHDEPIIDNTKSPEYNVNRKVSEFLEMMKKYQKAYATNNILVTMGDDFMYMNAHMYYKNMDKLIKYINKLEGSKSPFRAFYSTPSCYLKSVHDAQINLPVKKDDFFPYASDQNAFWTGYFTSRPTVKGYERKGNNFLQVCKQLYALSHMDSEMKKNLISLREAMGVMQHHDAVTGTEKQHVAAEYSRILTKGMNDCEKITHKALNKIMSPSEPIELKTCRQLNISSCDVTENEDSFVVTLYNPLSRSVNHLVRLPVKNANVNYSVKCPCGKEHPTQLVEIPRSVLSIPGRQGEATAELVFKASGIPPLGFKSFYVTKTSEGKTARSTVMKYDKQPIDVGFDDGLRLTLTAKGLLKSIWMNNKQCPVTQNIGYYVGAVGNNEMVFSGSNRSSGAYIFRPNSTLIPLADGKPKTTIYKGPVVTEIHQEYTDWASQIIRLVKGQTYAEFEWLVGPIPINDKVGKEIVSVFKSSEMHSNGEFFTDSNGRESLKRVLNHRDTWPLNLDEPIAGNYYPVTTRISIEDGQKTMSVITDRAQGGSSLHDGELELMIHRRLLHDDAFGVGEALNETAFGEGLVARGTHVLTLENNAKARMLVQEKVLNNWIFFTPTENSFEQWKKSYKMAFSGLESALPDNVQILTLEPWLGNSLILRLEHIIEKNDDPELSKPANVNIKNIFSNFVITKFDEMMLGANMKTTESERLHWNSNLHFEEKQELANDFNVILDPMQIRTFLIEIAPKSRFNRGSFM